MVTPPTDAEYVLPRHFEMTVPKDALAVLRGLMAELRAFREQVVGLGEAEACVLYNGDEYAMLLGDAFAEWTLAHVRRRLAKPSPRGPR